MGDINLVKVDDPKALGKAAISFMNKIEHACGWIATPKGVWKDHVEAKETFIKEIESNPHLTPFQKAAFISNAKQLIKQYKNQNDIFQMAMEQLDERIQSENVDDDWLICFFDKAKFVSNPEIQIIWGKLLAHEFDRPGKVSKRLIQVLSSLDSNMAGKFGILCTFAIDQINRITMKIGECPQPLIMRNDYEDLYTSAGLSFTDLAELQSVGLVQFSPTSIFWFTTNTMIFKYFENVFTVTNQENNIPYGQVFFTEIGQTLCRIISPSKRNDFLDKCFEYWKKKDCTVQIKS